MLNSRAPRKPVDEAEVLALGSPAMGVPGMWNPVHFTLLALLGLLAVACVGLQNGELNQVFYLLHGLHRAEPGLLTRDWYTMDSLSYHQWWDTVVALLARAGLLESGLTAGTVLLSLLFVAAVYAALRALYKESLLSTAGAVLVFCGLFTRGLGDWELLAPSIEPFSISGVLLICGLAFLARRQPAAAGVCLGLCALLHSHFAVLVTGVAALAALPILRFEGARFTLRLFVPLVLLAAPTLWQVLHFATAPGGNEALRILSLVGPQHYYPWRVGLRPFVIFGGAILFGVAGFSLRRPRFSPALAAVALSTLAMVCGSLVLCAAGVSPTLERALPWRLSSVIILIGLAAGCSGLYAVALQTAGSRQIFHSRRSLAWYALGLLALGAIAAASTSRGRWAILIVIASLVLLPLAALRPWSLRLRWQSALALLLVAGFVPIAIAEIPKSHWRIQTMQPETAGVFSWARLHSPPDSLWAVPPTWKDFRLNARRSVLADWSATPFFPADVIEWNRRMLALTGLPSLRTASQVTAAYDNIDCQRIGHLQQEFGLNFVVTGATKKLPCASPAFSDSHFTVWNLPPR